MQDTFKFNGKSVIIKGWDSVTVQNHAQLRFQPMQIAQEQD